MDERTPEHDVLTILEKSLAADTGSSGGQREQSKMLSDLAARSESGDPSCSGAPGPGSVNQDFLRKHWVGLHE